MMMNGGRSSRFPFTASQWEELEHQALVFKYMVSGMPIPQDLLFTIRTSLDSSLSSKFLLHHQPHHIGWNGFHMGFGRKVDPEPGRCRRTDGKKWRCSKEAYPDSKYCERHMHRGRNRSRKPVEILSQTPTKAINNTSITKNPPQPSLESHFPYPHFSNSSRPPGISFSSQENPIRFFLESNSAYSSRSPGKDYRNSYGPGNGLKGETDEHAFFSAAPNSNPNSGTTRSISDNSSVNIDSSWQLVPLTMGSTYSSGLENRQLQILTGQHNHDQNHYYSTDRLLNPDQRDHDQPKKVMHHFLDELPPKHKDSWPNPDENLSSSHRTQLSISAPPKSLHDFFMTQKW
ncbi:UNVERIFIED_CONTAM: Growth-regulating factor 1 [Sesamum radiatum]|uniref:Growth-regulating factor n=1 Tax=Sesamum radiatum TaxID=300843 RepID=A0AAW2L9G8_SESRA